MPARVPALPGCGIDWTRLHALPVAVPPESLTDAARLEYVRALAVSGDIPLTTYGRFVTNAPKLKAVRTTPPVGGVRYVLPRHSTAPGADATLPASAAGVVSSAAFSPAAPNAGTPTEVEDRLQRKLPFDGTSDDFSPLPIPVVDLDTFRFWFAPQAAPPFAGTLGLDEPGVLGTGGPLPAAVPVTLLETRQSGGTVAIGELDRLLLRAPVTGRFRFEPYYVYRWDGAGFAPVGPSNSGRLLVQQPELASAKGALGSETGLFRARTLVFENVDRASVVTSIRLALILQLAFVGDIVSAHEGAAGVEPRLAVPKSSPEVVGWILDGVNGLLRSWVAFLVALSWRPEDAAVAAALPAPWRSDPPTRPLKVADGKGVADAVTDLRGHADWCTSLLWFLEHVLAPRLAGHTWTEVLLQNGQDPAVRRFPVTKDQPPFTPRNAALALQHQRLRLTEDPVHRWVACYAGSPLGRPSAVYAPAPPPVGATTYPVGGLTAYELEVLHQAGTAHTALGLPAPAAVPGPRPGRAMDLAPYAAKAAGSSCLFGAARDGLHTTVDWLLELTRGIHHDPEPEPGFVDLLALMDPATGQGHPLLAPLRVDEHLKAVHLRRQMDDPAMTPLGADSLAWWDTKINFAKSGGKWQHHDADGNLVEQTPAPRRPYLAGDTQLDRGAVIAALPNLLVFEALLGASARASGFSPFDLESAYLACARMVDPAGPHPDPLPLAVLLALMETEGIKMFGPINRRVRDTTALAGAPWAWQGFERRPRADFPAEEDRIARMVWLLYPYGLDSFAVPRSDDDKPGRPTLGQHDGAMNAVVGRIAGAGVVALDPLENPAKYIRARVAARWHPSPPPPAGEGVPLVWKRSRRMHWAGLSLMAGFFRRRELQMHAPTVANGFAEAGWTPHPDWLPPPESPPDISGATPLDDAWRQYLSYYALVYLSYNTSPVSWRRYVKGAEAARPVGSPLSLRDYLLFQHARDAYAISNMVRFAIGLDAFMRLDYMEGLAPEDLASADANLDDPASRSWSTTP